MKEIIEGKKGSVTLTKITGPEPTPNGTAANPKIQKQAVAPKKLGFISRILRSKVMYIETALTNHGLKVTLTYGSIKKNFHLKFPDEIWKAFPDNSKMMLRDNLALLSSLELGVMLNAKKVRYDTPLPFFKSFFIEVLLKSLLYSGDCDSGKAIEYITRLCNIEQVFKGTNSLFSSLQLNTADRSINTMTFGKESLLGFGLAQEIGLNPISVTIVEPDSEVVYRNTRLRTFEWKHKYKLIEKFEKEFNLKIYQIYSELGDLRDYTLWDVDKTDLGWSNQLTQYLFLLLPFNCFFNSKYTIYGNEKSCDSYYYSDEGFKCHPVYDQSAEWMSHMNTMLNTIAGGSMKVTSLVQPLHEIAVAKILYQRYPELAKYQTSCHADNDYAEHNRWCGHCAKCATCFVYMKAFGFNPEIVGIKDMFSLSFKEYFCIFNPGKDLYSSILGKDEQLFAFQLAVKRGAKGELIDLFNKQYGQEAAAREEELKNEFFKIHSPLNIPPNLWKKIKPIFEEELKKDVEEKLKIEETKKVVEVKKEEKSGEETTKENKEHELKKIDVKKEEKTEDSKKDTKLERKEEKHHEESRKEEHLKGDKPEAKKEEKKAGKEEDKKDNKKVEDIKKEIKNSK